MTTNSFGEREQRAAMRLIELALAEDLGDDGDLTCRCVIPADRYGKVDIRVRDAGVVSGMPIVRLVLEAVEGAVRIESFVTDGTVVERGTTLATVTGPVRGLLTGERTALNFLSHLSGVATATRKFVEMIQGTQARILDTRKTLPGWRVLEKYAVRCGGGMNHRMGLYDAVMLKDNHLADWTTHDSPAAAVRYVRSVVPPQTPVVVEVDDLVQLEGVLPAEPDVVLLDNMTCEMLATAVGRRNAIAPSVQLEASGGITEATVRAIAATGVDRISIGALTHSATALDIGFDWHRGV